MTATSYSVDATGNLIKRGTDTFSYDSQNRLTSAMVNGTTALYQYNVAGQRVAKTVAGQLTYYLYGQDGQLLAEEDVGNGVITRQYIWLGNKPVAYLFGDKGYYVHTDNTDTPQVLTDSQQKVVWTTQTYPFGKQQYSGSIAFNLRYPGQYFDEETGLHYNGHRYYDPNTGRYITSDPIGLAGGVNTYAYVGNDPLGSIDPQGLNADDLSETPGQRSLEQLHSQEHDVISPLVDIDLNNDGMQDVISPVVMNAGAGKLNCKAVDTGRSGKQARLRALVNDEKLGTPDRGWIQQDINAINRGQRNSIRNPPGKDLAHERGREAAKGYGYEYSNLQDRILHRIQHKYDNFGRKNKERPVE